MTTPIFPDTNAIIDFVEQQHKGLQLLFGYANQGSIELLTSELALAEVLVRPLQRQQEWLLQLYEGLLVEDQVVRMLPIDVGILRRSAAIRAAAGGKTPDSIHVATAMMMGCGYLVSSDQRLRMPGGIRRIASDEIDAELMETWR